MGVKENVANRMRVARAERRMSQKQLAELIGSTQTHVTKLESGTVNIGVETLERIAEALHKPIQYFFEPFEEFEIPKPLPKPQKRAVGE